MSKVELTPEKLTKIKEDVKTYKHAYLINPATMLAIVEEIAILRRALQEITWDLCGIDLEEEQIDKICNEWIEKAKMLLESEATS